MNLKTLIRHYCANFDRSKCLGVKFHVNGTAQFTESDKVGKRCWGAVQRCKYFDRTVLPSLNKDHVDYHLMENAIHKYKMMKEGDYGPPETDGSI